MLGSCVFIVLSALTVEQPSPDAFTQEVAVLEDWGTPHYVSDRRDAEFTYRNQVRVLFRYANHEWAPSVADPSSVGGLAAAQAALSAVKSWTVVSDGKALGSLSSHAWPGGYTHDIDVGIQAISDGARIPRMGARADEYAALDTGPLRRPLVLVARPSYKDVDQWTRKQKTSVPGAVIDSLNSEELRDPYGEQWAPKRASSANVEMVSEYVSKNARRILTVRYRSEALKSDPEGSSPWKCANFTFLAVAGKPLRFLGPGMTLIDAGDYDGDGESEILFRNKGTDGDGNEYGYTLFYGHLEKTCAFSMTYH